MFETGRNYRRRVSLRSEDLVGWEAGSLSAGNQEPNQDGDFEQLARSQPFSALRILSSAFVCSRSFSGFVSAMTLEMTLAAVFDIVASVVIPMRSLSSPGGVTPGHFLSEHSRLLKFASESG
jgi:hypothetical protein